MEREPWSPAATYSIGVGISKSTSVKKGPILSYSTKVVNFKWQKPLILVRALFELPGVGGLVGYLLRFPLDSPHYTKGSDNWSLGLENLVKTLDFNLEKVIWVPYCLVSAGISIPI